MVRDLRTASTEFRVPMTILRPKTQFLGHLSFKIVLKAFTSIGYRLSFIHVSISHISRVFRRHRAKHEAVVCIQRPRASQKSCPVVKQTG